MFIVFSKRKSFMRATFDYSECKKTAPNLNCNY